MLKIIYDAQKRKFIAAEGAQIFRDDFVFSDKWNCRVCYDGIVKCIARDIVNEKYYEIYLKISPKGLVTISKMEDGKRNLTKKFRVKGWPCTGIIKLTGGPIENRNAYYNNLNSYK